MLSPSPSSNLFYPVSLYVFPARVFFPILFCLSVNWFLSLTSVSISSLNPRQYTSLSLSLIIRSICPFYGCLCSLPTRLVISLTVIRLFFCSPYCYVCLPVYGSRRSVLSFVSECDIPIPHDRSDVPVFLFLPVYLSAPNVGA